jgi:hypothetical protein
MVVTSLAVPQASPLLLQILYTFVFQLTYEFMQKALASMSLDKLSIRVLITLFDERKQAPLM